MSDNYNKYDNGRNGNLRRYFPREPQNEGHRQTYSGYDRHYNNRGSPRYYRSYLSHDKYKESHLKRPLYVHEPDHRRFNCHRDCGNYRNCSHSSQNRFHQRNPPRKEIFRSINDNEDNYRKYFPSTFNNNNGWRYAYNIKLPNISNENKFHYNQFPFEWHYIAYLTLENMKIYHAQLANWNNVRHSSFHQSRNNPSSRNGRGATNQYGNRRREGSCINNQKQRKFHNFKRNSYAHFKHFAKFDRKIKAKKILPRKQQSGNWDSTKELHDLAKPGLFHDFTPSVSSTPIKKENAFILQEHG